MIGDAQVSFYKKIVFFAINLSSFIFTAIIAIFLGVFSRFMHKCSIHINVIEIHAPNQQALNFQDSLCSPDLVTFLTSVNFELKEARHHR